MKIKAVTAALASLLCAPALAAEQCPSLIDTGRQGCANPSQEAMRACIAAKIPDTCHAELDRMLAETTTLPVQTVIGTRFGIDVDKYPGSVSVLQSEDLAYSPDLIRSLARVPGFDTGNDTGRSIGQNFSIRGFGHGNEDRVIVMQDGVRRSVNLFSNQVSSFRMDPDLLKEVEVVRGASSISHGGGAIGGVIGSTTKDASDFTLPGRDTGTLLHFRHDSNNSTQYAAAFAWAPQERPLEILAYAKLMEKGDIEWAERVQLSDGSIADHTHNDEQAKTLFLKAGLNFSDETRLKLSHYRNSTAFEAGWNSLYHYAYSNQNGAVIGDLVQKDTVLNFTSRGLSPWLDLSVTAHDSESYSEKGYERGIDLYYKNRDRRRGASAQNLMHFSTGPVNHRLLLGADYENRREDALYLRDGVPSDFGSMPNEYKDLGLFVQHESRYWDDRIALQLGGRYDRFDREVKGKPGAYDNTRFSPRAGLSFEVVRDVNLLLNYSESFRAPTPHETSANGPLNIHYWYLPNPDLGPEVAREIEGGFSWHTRNGLFSADDRLRIKAMYFHGRIKDLIAFTELPDRGPSPDNTPYATYTNVDTAKRHGLELETSYDRSHWGVFVNYETLDQYDSVTGEKVPNAFADKVRGGMHVRPFDDDFTLSFDVTHWFKPEQNPESFISQGQRYYYTNKSYSQSNFQMRWRPYNSHVPFFDDSMAFLIGINNVFDQKRLPPAATTTTTRVGEGRNVYVSISKRF